MKEFGYCCFMYIGKITVIYVTNRLVLGTALRGFTPIARILDRHMTGMGARFFRNRTVTAAASKSAKDAGKKMWYDGGKTLLSRMKNRGLVGGVGAAGATALRYSAANLAEGFQEVTQEAIAVGTEHYYTGLFHDPSMAGLDAQLASIAAGAKSQASGQGLEVFLSGFLMGGLVQPVQKLFLQGLPTAYAWGKGKYGSEQSKQEWQEYKERKENFVKETLKSLNEVSENPDLYFDETRLNSVVQKQLNERMLSSSYAGDVLSFMDDKDQSTFTHLHYLAQSGKSHEFKQMFKDYLKMTDAELKQAFPENNKDIKSGKLRERLTGMIDKVDEFQTSWNELNEQIINPFDKNKFIKGSNEYNEEAIRQLAFNHAKMLAMFTRKTFERALERSNQIYSELSQQSDNYLYLPL